MALKGRYPRISDIKNEIDASGRAICRNCSNPVAQNRLHYCSNACMDEFNRNNSWFWVRKDVLRRDRYTCNICKQRMRKKFLHVDHIIPVKEGGQLLEKKNLRTLCKQCHKEKRKLDNWAFKD